MRAMDRRTFIAVGAGSALGFAVPGYAKARNGPSDERCLWLQLWQKREYPERSRLDVFAAGVGGMLTASLIGGHEGICWAERLTDDEAFERTPWVEKSVKLTDEISSNPRLRSPLDFLFADGECHSPDRAVVVTVCENDKSPNIAIDLARYCRRNYKRVDAIAVVRGTFGALPASAKRSLNCLRAVSDFAFVADDPITTRIEPPDPCEFEWTYRAAFAARVVGKTDGVLDNKRVRIDGGEDEFSICALSPMDR